MLFHLVTKVLMPEKVKKDLCEQGIIGERLFQRFVEGRIKEQKVTLWDPMKKQKPSTWKTAGKKAKVRDENNTVELSEVRNLFARMMVVCKSRLDLDIKEAVGTKVTVCSRWNIASLLPQKGLDGSFGEVTE